MIDNLREASKGSERVMPIEEKAFENQTDLQERVAKKLMYEDIDAILNSESIYKD